jgi:hypothetical protein
LYSGWASAQQPPSLSGTTRLLASGHRRVVSVHGRIDGSSRGKCRWSGTSWLNRFSACFPDSFPWLVFHLRANDLTLSLYSDSCSSSSYSGIIYNSYGASTIQIAEGQTVISTGPYALVRHPMYAAALVMLVGIPLALGSWWGLFTLLLIVPVLIWRLLDEERLLRQNLRGYPEYQARVKYRLLPLIW